MKKLAIIALALTATAAFAQSSSRYSTPTPPPASSANGPEINDPSVQATVLLNTAVINAASFGGEAVQNIATNAGNVDVSGAQLQLVGAKNSLIMNAALGGEARQNLASNVGNVEINATSIQAVVAANSAIINKASFGSKAVQNVSTNTSCSTCD